MIKWKKILCPKSSLNLMVTLTGGQSFRWNKLAPSKIPENTPDADIWIGVLTNCLWILKQDTEHLYYKVLGELPFPESNPYHIIRMKVTNSTPKKSIKSINKQHVDLDSTLQLLYHDKYYEDILKQYFRLNVNLNELYEKWSLAHPHFKKEGNKLYGVRLLDQDPVENIFSFICSQNNHINRITSLVEKLCSSYGQKICNYNGENYYAFPDVSTLANQKNLESELRTAGFGYRAKFILNTANGIMERGNLVWFDSIRNLSYKQAHSELIQLNGIGPKVADCICLMSFNHMEAIPVDTHVFQIAKQHYLNGNQLKTTKSVTPSIYLEIGNKFRSTYGDMAGWTQTVLFCANLPKFNTDTSDVRMDTKVKIKNDEILKSNDKQNMKSKSRKAEVEIDLKFEIKKVRETDIEITKTKENELSIVPNRKSKRKR